MVDNKSFIEICDHFSSSLACVNDNITKINKDALGEAGAAG